MEERCPLHHENTENTVAYLQTLSLDELVGFTEQAVCMLSSSEQISYNINQFCSAYDDHDGRIRFFVTLVERGIIDVLNIPLSFMRNPEMVDFIRSPVFDFYVPAAKSAESVVAALTDEILEVFSILTVKNPRWIHVSEEREKASPTMAAVGDAIELLVDVSGYPEGAPVVFDVFDASSDPAMRIETVRGKTSGGTAKVSWKVNDPNEIGAELKLHFEGSARSKSSGIAPIDLRTIYKVEVRDEEKKPLEGIKVEFNVSGTKTVVTTNAMGLATHPANDPAIEAEVRILWDDAQSSESVVPTDAVTPSVDAASIMTDDPEEGSTTPVTDGSVYFLEIGESLMRFNSGVFLAQEATGENAVSGVGLIAACLNYAKKHPEQTLLIAAHTDSVGGDADNVKLSEIRAQAVQGILLGDKNGVSTDGSNLGREQFATSCNGPHLTQEERYPGNGNGKGVLWNDYIDVLNWASTCFGWPCSYPDGPSETLWGATKKFRDSYNASDVGGAPGEKIPAGKGVFDIDCWRAVFDCYEHILMKTLGVDAEGLSALRSGLKFVMSNNEIRYTKCGEYKPIENCGNKSYKSTTNRRVELLFFAPDKLPDYPCIAGTCNPGACKLDPKYHIPIPPDDDGPKPDPDPKPDPEKVTLQVKLLQDLKPLQDSAYELKLDNGDVLEGTTDGSGLVVNEIPATTESCEIWYVSDETDVRVVVKLCTIESMEEGAPQRWKGIKQRLFALGYIDYVSDADISNEFDEDKKDVYGLLRFQDDNGLALCTVPEDATVTAIRIKYGA